MNRFKLSILDRYIIKKYFGTYLFVTGVFMMIIVVFDLTEKIDDIIDNHAPLQAVIFDYFLNFIPFFASSYTPLFLFIAVIYFTSRLANKAEIIAMLNAGMTFRRLLRPFFIAAVLLCGLNIYANNWLIPKCNKTRIAFINTYIDGAFHNDNWNLHFMLDKHSNFYVANFSYQDSIGYKFAVDKFTDDGNLFFKLRAEQVIWNSKKKMWDAKNYVLRLNNGMKETLITGHDTLLQYNLSPKDFETKSTKAETMNAVELNETINDLTTKASGSVVNYKIEKYRRTAFPFAILILTLIGVSIASRKMRGGMGLHIALGFLLGFSYILFMQFSTTFSTNADLPPIIGVWIPNLIYMVVGLVLYKTAPK